MDERSTVEQLKLMFPERREGVLLHAIRNSSSIPEAVEMLLAEKPQISGEREIVMISSSPEPEMKGQREENAVKSAHGNGGKTVVGVDECIAMVVSMFPNISTDFVRGLYHDTVALNPDDVLTTVVNRIVEAGSDYPREEKRGKKRKRSPSEEVEALHPYLANDRQGVDQLYSFQAAHVLKYEFPLVPDIYIKRALLRNKNFLAPTYFELAETEASYSEGAASNKYKRLKSKRQPDRKETVVITAAVQKELEFARAKLQQENDAKVALEMENKLLADSGQLIECQCCFSDEKFDNMTQCREGHLFCMGCAKQYAETQVGMGKYQLVCMDGSGCKAEFPRTEILRFVDEKCLSALDKLQQEAELRLAELDGLEKCPFCDYAVCLGPVEEDREFKCGNPECAEVSCRLCKEKSHTPLSCEEHAKENKISVRHAVEEAMTAAMIRTCNKCSNKFIKDSGCNKMTCTRCGAMQCYVCSKTIENYQHFERVDSNGKMPCPLYDNHEARHEEEIKRAAEAKVAELKANDPSLNEKDLAIELSEEAKRLEQQRQQAAQRQAAVQGGVRAAVALPGIAVVGAGMRAPPGPYVPGAAGAFNIPADMVAAQEDAFRRARENFNQRLVRNRQMANLYGREERMNNIQALQEQLRRQRQEVQNAMEAAANAGIVPAQQRNARRHPPFPVRVQPNNNLPAAPAQVRANANPNANAGGAARHLYFDQLINNNLVEANRRLAEARAAMGMGNDDNNNNNAPQNPFAQARPRQAAANNLTANQAHLRRRTVFGLTVAGPNNNNQNNANRPAPYNPAQFNAGGANNPVAAMVPDWNPVLPGMPQQPMPFVGVPAMFVQVGQQAQAVPARPMTFEPPPGPFAQGRQGGN